MPKHHHNQQSAIPMPNHHHTPAVAVDAAAVDNTATATSVAAPVGDSQAVLLGHLNDLVSKDTNTVDDPYAFSSRSDEAHSRSRKSKPTFSSIHPSCKHTGKTATPATEEVVNSSMTTIKSKSSSIKILARVAKEPSGVAWYYKSSSSSSSGNGTTTAITANNTVNTTNFALSNRGNSSGNKVQNNNRGLLGNILSGLVRVCASYCGQAKPRNAFTGAEWDRGAQACCKKCCKKHAYAKSHRTCGKCACPKPRGSFADTEWARGAQACCKTCCKKQAHGNAATGVSAHSLSERRKKDEKERKKRKTKRKKERRKAKRKKERQKDGRQGRRRRMDC